MKLSKLNHRLLPPPGAFEGISQKIIYFRILLKFIVIFFILAVIFLILFKSSLLKPIWGWALNYFFFCVEKVSQMSGWQKFWLLGPAILFDTTRYYFTNLIVFIVQFFKRLFIQPKPHPYDNPANCPFVSVIIPVYNEEKTIRHTIESILANHYPHYEVLVVDDCSTDQTSSICRKYQKEGKIRYLRKTERGGKPAVLNYGLNFAKGEIVIHFDGDSIFYRDTIYEAVKPFIDPKVGAVAGNLKVLNDRSSLPARLQAAEYGMGISVQRIWLSMTDTLQIASGAFGCFRKKLLLSLKGTDPEVGEDSDITLKIRKMGYKVRFVAKAISFTDVPPTWRALYRQRVLWDRCYIRVNLRKHFNIANFRHFRFGDFLAVVTDLIFNLGLLFIFPIYIWVIGFWYPHLILFILAVTYLYYTFMNFIQMLIVVSLSDDPGHDFIFIFYTPIFFVYSCYLRTIRIHAYLLEIFRSSRYKKGYFPEKIWKGMPEYW